MPETLVYTGVLVVRRCWCGIRHSIPSELASAAEERGLVVFCPLGHEWVVRETDKVRLSRELTAERQRRQAEHELRLQEERSHSATKGHLTRTKRRVAAGVCPCCGRTFQQLARHMETKHPEYGGARAQA